jgi:S1-C subfamily serine protease
MSASISETTSTLVALSNNFAATVERSGAFVVTINARQRLSSSGVHWQQGVIVTADHTIRRDSEITVTLPDGRTVPAILAGRDSSTDLALLKLREEDSKLPTAEIGDTSSLKVGHMVFAVGRSRESGLSASLGVVSALGSGWRTWNGGQIDQLVKLDLTLYSGFSGGPLVDAAGKIVGINTSGPRNMVLAIPVTTVNRVVDGLLSQGRIARGYLGVGMQPVLLPDNLKNALNLSQSGGVIIVNTEPNGPAEQAGVLIGDVLVGLEGKLVSDTGDVQALLGPESVGKTLTAKIVRGGQVVELTITVGERPQRGES